MGKKEEKIIIKTNQVKRKMSPVELQMYLRENKRGTGVHGVKSNKTKRRQEKQKRGKE